MSPLVKILQQQKVKQKRKQKLPKLKAFVKRNVLVVEMNE